MLRPNPFMVTTGFQANSHFVSIILFSKIQATLCTLQVFPLLSADTLVKTASCCLPQLLLYFSILFLPSPPLPIGRRCFHWKPTGHVTPFVTFADV